MLIYCTASHLFPNRRVELDKAFSRMIGRVISLAVTCRTFRKKHIAVTVQNLFGQNYHTCVCLLLGGSDRFHQHVRVKMTRVTVPVFIKAVEPMAQRNFFVVETGTSET